MKYTETPLQELQDPFLKEQGVRIVVKREDLNHPHVSGNKWWKLKGVMDEARLQGKTTLITFGGAFSNHIVATAAAARESGLKSIGIIRGERILPLNTSLAFAEQQGMQLEFVSREVYRSKTDPEFLTHLSRRFGEGYIIPEGGTNDAAIRSVAQWAQQLMDVPDFDFVCLPAGTGGTLAGLISGFGGSKQLIGFSVLKGNFLTGEVDRMLTSSGSAYRNWSIENEYHFGGYAKSHPDLEKFMARQWEVNRLPLEPVYSGKMLFGVYDLIRKGRFSRSSVILVLHTGGLESMRDLSS